MKELTLTTLVAVFEEMLGGSIFWLLVALAILITLLYLYVLVRDRSVSLRKFFLAQLSMPFGAMAAVWLVLRQTESRLNDVGGPVDVITLLAIAAAGAVGTSILVYTVQSLIWRPRG